jgi:hypothetical protein
MKTPYNERNASRQGNLSRAAARLILGHLKPFKRKPRKKPYFWGGVPCFFDYLTIIVKYFLIIVQ